MKTEARVTLALVLTNAVIYIISVTLDPSVTSLGVMNYELVSEGQIYRIVSAMFLHGGLDHLFGNMFLLFAVGTMVEQSTGPVKYLVIYFVTGIAGNLTSYFWEMASGLRYNSLGASGAVYGVMAALIVLALKRIPGVAVVRSRIPLAIIYCIYSSFAMPNIDYAAHIGGLVSGIILTSLMIRRPRINNDQTFLLPDNTSW